MKKTGKSIIAVSLAAVMCCLSACGASTAKPGSGANEEDNSNKTILTIAAFDGGLGIRFLEEAGDRFEKAYADVSFEKGKKGVSVNVISGNNYSGNGALASMKKEAADVWFTEGVIYKEHLNMGNFADITDIVTEKLTKYGEDKSIADKMDAGFRDFLNIGTEDKPQYYAIPFYDNFYGFQYDRDIFEKNNLYFKHSGSEAGDAADKLGFVASASDKKAAGVDGKLGTYDDGLPATYAQLLTLVNKMVEKNITPFVYGPIDYVKRTMAAFWAQAEGAKEFELNKTFNGTATNIAKIDASGHAIKNANGTVQTETVAINKTNGYELQRQASKYYVLELFEKLASNEKYRVTSELMHTTAQSDFLKGKNDQFATYGMLIDGAWWFNESAAASEALVELYGEEYAQKNRNVAMMPLPVPTADQVGKGSTLYSQNDNLAFIRSTTDIMDCAKAFLQFTSTDAELSAFTATNHMTRALQYELTDEYKDKVTAYGKSVLELKNDSTVVYPYVGDDFYINNQETFNVDVWSWTTKIDGTSYLNPWQLWITMPGKYSANDYFAGMRSTRQVDWRTINNK